MYKRISIFGDSITWGAIDTEMGGWVERLKIEMFRKDRLKDISNLGVSADTTEELLKRFESEARARRADIIVIAIGINDSWYWSDKNAHRVSIEQFQTNLNRLIDISEKITKEVHFVGLTPVVDRLTTPVEWIQTVHYKNEWVGQYDQILKTVCQQRNVSYIPMNDLLVESDLPDGLHPGPTGHQKMFERILTHLNLVD